MLKNNHIPLYYQIATDIKHLISKKEFGTTNVLPGEIRLAKTYGVSRTTVRQAINSLKQEGLIVTKRGQGNIIKNQQKLKRTGYLTGFFQDMAVPENENRIKILEFSNVKAPRSAADCLGLEEGKEVLYIEKFRTIKNDPFSYSVNYVPLDIGNKINIEDAKKNSLFLIVEKNLRVTSLDIIQSISADIADNHQAKIFKIRIGDPVINVKRVCYVSNNKPVLFSSIYYRADRFTLVVKLITQRSKKNHELDWKAERLNEKDKFNYPL